MPTIGTDKAFLTSASGLLRIAEIMLSLCGIICIESIDEKCYSSYVHRYEFALFVLIASLLFALFVIGVFVMRAQEALTRVLNFPFFLLVLDSFTGVFYMIACLLEFCAWCDDPDGNASTKVAGVFGMFSMICFVLSSYGSYKFFQDEKLPLPPPPGLHPASVASSRIGGQHWETP